MPKNETVVESKTLPPETAPGDEMGGCSAYRTGLVLTALQKKLAQAGSEEERAGIMAEIEALEEKMGL